MKYKSLPYKLLTCLILALPSLAMAQLTPHEAIIQMKKGINMGNTLESPYEGEWTNGPAQEYYFDTYKKAGFDFIRIPVRWDKHLGTATPYTVNETWFKRVEQIIDWGLARGFYIIVNSHHDGWIKENYDNPVNQARFDSLWSQIAIRFKDKPEKLIFEICNEPQPPMTKAQNDMMHKRAIAIVRKTNPTRLVIFQGIDWGGSDALINAAIPPNDHYLIGSFHTYDPWPFGLEGTGTFTTTDANNLKIKFQKVKDWSVKNNIPVFLGEFGGTSKCEYNARMRQYKTYVELSETFGFAPCAWDDGGEFKIMFRSAKAWYDDIKDMLVNSSVLSPKIPRLTRLQDSIIRVDWVNAAANYDSISIERRTNTTTFVRVAQLKGDVTTFSEYKLAENTEYFYRVVAHCNDSTDLYSYPVKIFMPVYIPKVRKLYTGQALPIPGKVEAENFDAGGEGLTYHDSDTKNIPMAYRPNEPVDILDQGNGIYHVIDNNPGEWLEYTVNVAEKGLYDVNVVVAAFTGGGTFRIKIGSVESPIYKALGTYSWSKTKTVPFTMNLEAGTQIMRLTFIDKPLFYIDHLEFIKKTTVGVPSVNNDNFNVLQNQQELIVNLENNNSAGMLKIYNILGTEVKAIKNPESGLRISKQDLPSGIYIVQLITGNNKLSNKIIIQ